jgi:hypothetical protein
LDLTDIPTIKLSGLSDAQKRAYVIADNKLAMNAGWDVELLKLEFQILEDEDFELDLLGFSLDEISDIFGGTYSGENGDSEPEANYSRKIESPVYEIKGDEPPVTALLDETKTQELRAEIDNADIDPDIAEFLYKAADRHTVFDFGQIAEYYAHAPENIQQLMERSALIIIDFDQAIDEGFVVLTKAIGELADQEPQSAE